MRNRTILAMVIHNVADYWVDILHVSLFNMLILNLSEKVRR
jgi:hypothetical protein